MYLGLRILFVLIRYKNKVHCCTTGWNKSPHYKNEQNYQWLGESSCYLCSGWIQSLSPFSYILVCEKSIRPYFFAKTWWISMKRACMILNLLTHAWIFSRLSIASVDGKQHLSEVVISALVGFSLYCIVLIGRSLLSNALRTF